jgi:hypothetical protein
VPTEGPTDTAAGIVLREHMYSSMRTHIVV